MITAEEIATELDGKRSGNGWKSRCPAHDDSNPSLSISEGDDKRPLVYCHGGCPQDTVIDALRRMGLWDNTSVRKVANGGTILDFNPRQPFAKREFDWHKPTKIYEYLDAKGGYLYSVLRNDFINNGGERDKDFRQGIRQGDGSWIKSLGTTPRVLYRLPELLQYPGATVFPCEGEKDADRVASLGLCATTVASGNWRGVDVSSLAGCDCIIPEDNDEAGRKKALATAKALSGTAKSIRILRLPGLPEKGDVSDWLDAGHCADQLCELGFAAPLWEPDEDTLVIATAADLEMCGVDWLWPGRFALGKFGLIAGLPDKGKGQIAAFIAAAVTARVPLPCDEGFAPQGNVLWFNAEDGQRDTVLPRLIAAGADPARVHFVNGARIRGVEKVFNLATYLQLLRQAIERIGNVVLVIIDPVSAYLGVGKVDGRSATDVRGVLTPLTDMVEELHVSVIGIAHFNKKDDVKSALLRVSDSIAYVAAARHVYAVLDDPEDKDSKLFVKAKNNLSPDKSALRYGMGVKTVGRDLRLSVDIAAPYIVWFPQHIDITANEAMEAGGGKTAKREAKEFLLDRLEAGPVKSDTIFEDAKQEGIAVKTLKRAKKELGVKSRKDGLGGWTWELPAKRATYAPQ